MVSLSLSNALFRLVMRRLSLMLAANLENKEERKKNSIAFSRATSGGSKGVQGTRAPWGSKFFQFHAGFGKFWQNRMLGPAPGGLEPPPREILDPPLVTKIVILISNYKISLREV